MALDAGRPPDFAFGIELSEYLAPWAFEDRLVDLSDAIGHFSDLFDHEVLDWVRVLNGRTEQNFMDYPLAVAPCISTSGRAYWNARALPYSEGMGGILVVLVRRGPACGAEGH
jgi:hypothetical protein